MKNHTRCFLTLTALLMFPLAVSAQKHAGDFEIGLGVAYGFETADDGALGMNFNVYYSVIDEIRFGADFTYYLVNDVRFQDPRFYELNLNSNYHLINQEVFRLYVLLGLHYMSRSYLRPVTGSDAARSENEIGLNAGGGLELDYDSIILFAEPRITVNGYDQPSITLGGRFFF